MFYWKKINLLLLVLLLVLIISSVYSLILPGFVITDDGTWMVIRLSAFFDSLRDGQIPVRVVERLNNGYGYPVSNFLYPGFLYIGSIFHILGLSFVDSIKAVFVVSMVLSGIFSYFWLKKIFDPLSSFVGSLFYVYTPYHLFDLYTRGSIGEILAFAWVPFIFWQIERRSLHFVAIGIFLLLLSHNSLAALIIPMILLYGIFSKKFVVTFFGVVVGVAMSSFFVIPALLELSYTRFSNTQISNPFEYFAQVSLVGYSSIVVLFVFTAVLISMRGAFRFIPHKSLIFMFFIISIFSIFLSTGLSRIFWEVIPSQFLQFPYRVLSLLVVSLSFIASFVISKIKGWIQIIVLTVLVGVLIYSAFPFLIPKGKVNYEDSYYSTNMDTTTVKDEYLPIWVKQKALVMPEKKVEVISGGGQIQAFTINSRKVDIDLENSANTTVRVNAIYYPGWKAFMNNERLDISYDNPHGTMDVLIKRNAGKLTLVFEETPLRFFANLMTVLSLLGVLFLLLRPILKFK